MLTEIFKLIFWKIKRLLRGLNRFGKLKNEKTRYAIENFDLVGSQISIRG